MPTLHTGLAPVRSVLDGGTVVFAKRTSMLPAVTISLGMRAGSICDPPVAAGLTYFLSRVIDRGTATRSADDIAEELDSRGITLTLNVTRHLFSVVCTCLAEDFEAVVALLGDILVSPSLPDEEIGTRKGEVITGLRQDEDNPAVRAVESLMALLYPEGHPYGLRAKGTVDTVGAITRDRLVALHASRFAPGELTAAIVGDVEPARATSTIARVFGPWRRPAPAPVPLAHVGQAPGRRRLVIPMMNKTQADIAYGFTTITRADPAYYAFWLVNNAFGQYSLGGRLGDNIRERQGMAYYVGSVFDANVVEGPLMIRAGVGPANVDRALAAIDEEITRLVADGLTAKELNDSRQYLTASMPRALETNAGIAAFLQSVEFFGLGLDYDVRLPALLAAVTLDEANAAARRLLDPARATVVIAGPYAE